MDFFDNEFFDTNLYHVFRKDRDSIKKRCLRGGGVLIAVRRELRCIAIYLQNEDSLLDQLCVSLAGPTETIFLTVSYPEAPIPGAGRLGRLQPTFARVSS